MTLPLLLLATAAASAAATAWLVRAEGALRIMDRPNERSLHEQPVPRTGGIAILAAVALAWGALAVLGFGRPGIPLMAGAAMVAAISFLDDVRPVPPQWRLAVHGVAATLFVVASESGLSALALPGGGLPLPGAVGTVLAVLLVVWMTNLYNFMDGMDGFAGGMTVVGFGTLSVIAELSGTRPEAAVWGAAVAAGAAGFLPFNFPPARIFLGDTGSATLGFLAGALILGLDHQGAAPAWVGLLVFAPFVLDATATLLRRMMRREAFWQPHTSHYYQRLVQSGWSHRRTVLVEYALMAFCAGLGLLLLEATPRGQALGLAVAFAVFVGAHVAVGRART